MWVLSLISVVAASTRHYLTLRDHLYTELWCIARCVCLHFSCRYSTHWGYPRKDGQAELTWVTNRAWRWLTSLVRLTPLPTKPNRQVGVYRNVWVVYFAIVTLSYTVCCIIRRQKHCAPIIISTDSRPCIQRSNIHWRNSWQLSSVSDYAFMSRLVNGDLIRPVIVDQLQ